MYRLIQALRKSGEKEEIPDLLKRLASLREQAAEKERQQYRFKLIEGERSGHRRLGRARRTVHGRTGGRDA